MHAENVAEILSLTQGEAVVYLEIARRSHANAGELIKATGMYRAAVYDILDRLIEKGLVGFVNIGKVREFNIIPLSVVQQKMEKEAQLLKKREAELQKLGEFIKAQGKTESLEVIVLKGKESLLTILNDMLENAEEWHVFGAQGNLKKLFPLEYRLVHRKRVERGISMKIIYNSTVRAEKRESELGLIEARYVSRQLDAPATTYIYGNRVAIILFANPLFVTWIKSREITKSYENQFQILWRNARR